MEVYSPEDVGMSSERLARVQVIMEELVKDNQFPGIMTLAQRKGKVVHLGKYGMMDIEAGKPMQEDALFRLYSMTKPIMSVAVMLLFEEGRLTLNDLVSQYIPSFAQIKVETGSGLVEPDPAITLYHLITHTSGLGYYTEPFEQRSPSLAEAANHIVIHCFFNRERSLATALALTSWAISSSWLPICPWQIFLKSAFSNRYI